VSADAMKSLQDSNLRLETRIKELNAENSKYKDKCQQEISNAELKVSEAHEKLLKVQTSEQAIKSSEQQLLKKIEILEVQLKDLNSSHEISNTTIHQLETANNKLNNDLMEVRSQHRKELMAKQEHLDEKVVALQKELEENLDQNKLLSAKLLSEKEAQFELKLAQYQVDAKEGKEATQELQKVIFEKYIYLEIFLKWRIICMFFVCENRPNIFQLLNF
jgi:chromosome segregation ATPase